MTIATATSSITPDDLQSMPNAVDFELVNGNLVERHMGSESSAIALVIGSLLLAWAQRQLAHVFTTDCGYQCFKDAPDKVRKPDVSVVVKGRLAGEKPPEGYVRIPPDLAVEVLSPGDLAYEIDEKVAEYLRAGGRLIWVVNPRTKTVRIHRPARAAAGPISSLDATGRISGEDVLQGFECAVSAFSKV
jgi:Uma2 family endonuclease